MIKQKKLQLNFNYLQYFLLLTILRPLLDTRGLTGLGFEFSLLPLVRRLTTFTLVVRALRLGAELSSWRGT